MNSNTHQDEPLSREEVRTFYKHRLGVGLDKVETRVPCPLPSHKGERDSFAVNSETGKWFCHSECGQGGDLFEFEKRFSGFTSFPAVKESVYRIVGRPLSNGNGHNGHGNSNGINHLNGHVKQRPIDKEKKVSGPGPITERYVYLDENNKPRMSVTRHVPKEFRQWTPEGKGWKLGVSGVERILYRLPQVLAAQELILVEGERDVHTAESLGFVATTNPMGAGKWHPSYTADLAGKTVTIFPDNDDAGMKHRDLVISQLAGHAAVFVAAVPPPHKDVTAWVEAGAVQEDILRAIEQAKPVESTVKPLGAEEPPNFAEAGSPEPAWEAEGELTDEPSMNAREAVNRIKAAPVDSAYSDAEPELRPDLISFLLNDHGNSERLIAMFGSKLRYSHEFKKWLVWDGRRWMTDHTDQAKRYAKLAMLEFLKQAVAAGKQEQEKFARNSLDSKKIHSMLTMAESEIYVSASDLDTDPFLLNFKNGTVDLRTSILQPHSQSDLITKLVHYDFNPQAQCDTWLRFLNEVMGGGPDAAEVNLERAERMIIYLQRAIGYSCTGSTIEKAVFVPHGTGDNGKSTMLSTFRDLIEEYSVLLQVDTLMVRQESNNTQADLADLRGARFVQTSETEEGQRIAQGKLKRITQGMGRIKAVRKYENPIEFYETHKLWMDTNRKPTIRDADDTATFKRLHPIPFEVKISEDRIDRGLPAKLINEAEGILAWAVKGARLWHESGLKRPAEVDAARSAWRAESDTLGTFLEECCIVGEQFRCTASAIYSEYKRWSEQNGEKSQLSSTAFGLKVTDKGFEKVHNRNGWMYLGIGLRATDA